MVRFRIGENFRIHSMEVQQMTEDQVIIVTLRLAEGYEVGWLQLLAWIDVKRNYMVYFKMILRTTHYTSTMCFQVCLPDLTPLWASLVTVSALSPTIPIKHHDFSSS